MFNKRRDKELGKTPSTSDANRLSLRTSASDRDSYTSYADPGQPADWVEAKSSSNANLKPSVISEGFEFVGEIRSNGYLTIDGIVRGTLALHSVQVGATGILDGTVVCDVINVKGKFSGFLECSDLTIGSRAMVDGKLVYKSITIQRGGVVKGEMKKKG